MSTELKKSLLAILEPVGQTHLLRFWDSLTEDEQSSLAGEIKSIDWPTVLGWVATAGEGLSEEEKAKAFPAPYKPNTPKTHGDKELYEQAIALGKKLLSEGKVAAFTVAGGQGTRLGFDHPKGTYPTTPIKNKSLFQIFAEGILRTQKKYSSTIYWYIMTSPANNGETVTFFKDHNYFGLNPSQVMFFAQAMLPSFDISSGKALLASPGALALSANGHGGSFAALHDSGALADMLNKGINTLSYWQVDNPLIRQFDPLFLGMHNLLKSDMSSRALIKRDYKEKLGHFCILDGKSIIIEYSDMPDDMLKRLDSEGLLAFRAGSPAIHVLSTDFIDRITRGKLDFQPHRALKKVPYIDEHGTHIAPEAPNAVKLEFFLFDALPLANNPLVLEGDRDEEFAPIKNPDGQDSPASCRQALLERTARWFDKAAIPFPRNADGTPAALVELSPAVYGGPDDIAANAARIPAIKAGDSLYID